VSMDEKRGLYSKFIVSKGMSEALLTDVFVLRPEKDPAALAALGKYAETTNNKKLAYDLYDWIDEIEETQ